MFVYVYVYVQQTIQIKEKKTWKQMTYHPVWFSDV